MLTPTGASCDFGNPSSTNIPATWCRYEVPGRLDDREFIMSKEKQENDHKAALAMIEELCQRYPKTFTHEPHHVRPLARGIREAIGANAPDLPDSVMSQALSIYAAWLPYSAPASWAHHASISVATPQAPAGSRPTAQMRHM